MKNKTILLGMALAIFATLFTSCQKEDISSSLTQEIIPTSNLFTNVDLVTFTNPDLAPEGPSAIPVKIITTSCPTGGYTLTVTSTEVDLEVAGYTINWYKNTGQEIHYTGQNLQCVCGYGLRVEVLDDSGNPAGSDSLDVPSC